MRLVTTHGSSEVVNKLYEPLADEYREIGGLSAGDVAICAGLKVIFSFQNRTYLNLLTHYRTPLLEIC